MAKPSQLPTQPIVSPKIQRRLERALMSQLTRFGSLQVRRGAQMGPGVLRQDGPDADALRTHALAWADAQLHARRHPYHAVRALELALSDMTSDDVAAWLTAYLATTPRLVP